LLALVPDMPITCIIFCRAMMSEVEKAKAQADDAEQGRAEPYNGVFMGMSTISIAVLCVPNWASLHI